MRHFLVVRPPGSPQRLGDSFLAVVPVGGVRLVPALTESAASAVGPFVGPNAPIRTVLQRVDGGMQSSREAA